jgi:hypothetical protein
MYLWWKKNGVKMVEMSEEHIFLQLIKEYGCKKVAEVGVASGTLANRVLCDKDQKVQEYYAVDPWKVYLEAFNRPPTAKELDQEYWDWVYEKVRLLKKKHKQLKILRNTSYEAASYLRKEGVKLDCVYIDAVHDERNIIVDCYYWMPVLKNEGILSGHDYGKSYMDMAIALDNVFGEDLNLILLNPNNHRHSYKNVHQSNWWVFLNKYKRDKFMTNIEEMYPQHLINNQEDINNYHKYLWERN